MRAWSLTLMFILPSLSLAASLGVVGETFPVQEMSLLQLIEIRLQELLHNGAWDNLQASWIRDVEQHANRPKPYVLKQVLHTHIHYYTPEIVLTQDVVDAKHQVLFSAGTRVNALQALPQYQPCWIFFNADETNEVHWAKKAMLRCAHPKLILTSGAMKEAQMLFHSAIYFDQEGRISRQLSIASSPSMVTRFNNDLVIREVALKDNGDEL